MNKTYLQKQVGGSKGADGSGRGSLEANYGQTIVTRQSYDNLKRNGMNAYKALLDSQVDMKKQFSNMQISN